MSSPIQTKDKVFIDVKETFMSFTNNNIHIIYPVFKIFSKYYLLENSR